MSIVKSYLKQKIIIAIIALLGIQISIMGCMAMLLGGNVIGNITPTADVAFAEEYKLVGHAAKVNWAEMLIYDTVRYENDFSEADPKETVYEFFGLDFEEREKEKYCVKVDEEGKCTKYETRWVTVEKRVVQGKEETFQLLDDLGYESDLSIFEITKIFIDLNKKDEYIIKFSGVGLEDLMTKLTADQIEWIYFLVSESFIFEMYGDIFDLPDHIPVAEDVKFAWPTPTLNIVTSPYGWRADPITNDRAFHYGIDISGENAMGEPIISIADGEIFQVNYSSSAAGYNVRVKHIDKEGYEWESRYCHMSQIQVVSGDKVKQGDVIGAVGNTGRSTGPHIHFELRFEGQLVDPYPYIKN
ncbi:M23 family metallopeptidase [Alkaliphilus pronyensis]|uniref:M23 family metallopeptidase n=1 Tax=Alkaliphilus pronyensis TaxID=1482732 RepID=A0A6I0F6H8_9FIRM|nr:M23 family metallopeptidase [Alkaliphilus pronyensis]KAB3535639.1 M23 family metallopeptidase [Alkaliphilus pronyensis]